MANLSEDIQCAGSDTRPPMLDKTDFASWQQRIRLYCRGKDNGVNILKSIDEGPFQMGTTRDTLAEGTEGSQQLGPERARVYSDLSPEDKDMYNANIRTTNILLQGLQKDIYTLINHYTDAKDIWDNVKMLLEGSELTKEDRESQLMQLNSKFVNNMLPEWGRFVTAVKLNRGLRDSNYDQLYAYLKQHEAHANENKMMLDRFTQHTVDPLALMSNVSHQNQATVQDGRVVVQNVQGRQNRGQGNNARGAGAAGYGGAQNRVRNANPEYFKDKILLMQAQENGVALDEEQLLFIAYGQDNVVDEDVDEQPVQDLALNVDNVFQADDYPVHDEASPLYDLDILSEANYMSESNMIPYDQYVKDNAVPVVQSNVSSVPNDAYMMILNGIYEPSAQCVSVTTHNNVVDNLLTAELATYKEQVKLYERRVKFQLTEREQKINEQLWIVIADRNRKEESLKRELHSNKVAIGYKNPLCLTRAQQVQPALYNGHEIIKTNHVPAIVHNSEDTLEIAEITRKKMNDKMKDRECVKKKVKITPHDYLKENYLATFTPQKQLTPDQIFWYNDLIKMKAEALKEQTTTS
ncbi:hypothetical protein Tco_1578509 [Tanacetum coccineum]